jgi:hypothetical protein
MDISYYLMDEPVIKPVFKKFSGKCEGIVAIINFEYNLLNSLPGRFELRYNPCLNQVYGFFYGVSAIHCNMINDLLPLLTTDIKEDVNSGTKESVKEVHKKKPEEFFLVVS